MTVPPLIDKEKPNRSTDAPSEALSLAVSVVLDQPAKGSSNA